MRKKPRISDSKKSTGKKRRQPSKYLIFYAYNPTKDVSDAAPEGRGGKVFPAFEADTLARVVFSMEFDRVKMAFAAIEGTAVSMQ